MRVHYGARRVSKRVENKRRLDRLVLAVLLVSGFALFLADGVQPLSASPAMAMSSRFSSTDLALPRFLRSINPRSPSLSLALLPAVRQAPDRAWGGRVNDLDFARSRAPHASDPGASSPAGSSNSELPALGLDDLDDQESREGERDGTITSGFGFRRLGGTVRHHDGIDVSLPHGAPIRAHEEGVVVFAGWRNGYGLTVILDHGAGKETLYAHASSLRVRVGQVVQRGDIIAAVGATGRAYGAHLHFEIRRDGRPIDPEREFVNSHG